MRVRNGGLNLEVQATRLFERRMKEKVDMVKEDLRARAPVWSGELRESIVAERISRFKWIVYPTVDYAVYAEHGNHANSPDGLIHVKNAKAMPLTRQGDRSRTAYMFSKAVKPHKASNFVEKTAKKYK